MLREFIFWDKGYKNMIKMFRESCRIKKVQNRLLDIITKGIPKVLVEQWWHAI